MLPAKIAAERHSAELRYFTQSQARRLRNYRREG